MKTLLWLPLQGTRGLLIAIMLIGLTFEGLCGLLEYVAGRLELAEMKLEDWIKQ